MAGALIVFDITRRDTYDHALSWLDEIHEHGNSNISVMLVGNKADMEDRYRKGESDR